MTESASFQVVMTAPNLADSAIELLREAGCTIHYMSPYPSAEAVATRVSEVQAHAILSRQGPVSSAAMDSSRRLRIIARHGVGVDDVDLEAARARGIMVTRAPGSNTQAVAEHTIAMILAMAKDFRGLGDAIATGQWRGGTTKVRDVQDMRLGLLGLGAIGRSVAMLAHPFGMKVIALGRPGSVTAFPSGVERAASLRMLLINSDVLSIHCPYDRQTHHIIDADALALMPRGSYLVNTSRGGIVDESALASALDAGHIAGAALDVFEVEPPPIEHVLRRHPKVVVTPHVSGVTDRSLVNMGLMAAESIVACLSGREINPAHIVVP